MTREKHESVSSGATGAQKEVEQGGNLYESVSSEGESVLEKAGEDVTADQFEGKCDTGEIELVAGFDAQRALGEGMPYQFLTDEYTSLGEIQPEEYPEPETVCGRDDRVRISPATATPWRWICQLAITFPNGASFRGTGWFIGARCVMTAGHCVFSRANGGWARRIEVIPGMDGSSRPFGSQIGTTFRSVTGWTNSGDPTYDYGAIILPNRDLGNRVGWFGFASLSDASLNNLFVNNSGYPGDKPFGTQWFNSGRITQITARKIYYMIDTFGGQSGSPVWRLQNGQRHAVGVHAYGGCPNSATRITLPVYNNMLAWRNI